MSPLATWIRFVSLASHTAIQNAGVFIGETNITGWDTHLKYNTGRGAVYGHFNFAMYNFNYVFDGYEWMDGIIHDEDYKVTVNTQV